MIAFRPWEEGDRQFVVETFLDSYRTVHAAGLIAMDDWKPVMGAQFRKVLKRPRVEVVVAFKPGEESRVDLYGWVAVERGHPRPYVIFCYVKQPYRLLGIARRLVRAAGVDPTLGFDYACKTPVVTRLSHQMRGCRWEPLAIRFPPPEVPQGGEAGISPGS